MTLFRRAFVVGAVLVALLGILSAYRDGYFENDFDRMVAPAVMVSTMLPDGSNLIGSGTVIASILKDGKYETYVLTAHHVVVAGKQADGTWLPIAIYSFSYHDRRRVEGHEHGAVVVKESASDDLALLMFTDNAPFQYTARMGNDPDYLDRVYAVGFPFGLYPVITEGIVSGLHVTQGIVTTTSSASTVAGNSGGALYNFSRKLIGVPQAVFGIRIGGMMIPIGLLNFSIPISTVKKFLEDSPVNGGTR